MNTPKSPIGTHFNQNVSTPSLVKKTPIGFLSKSFSPLDRLTNLDKDLLFNPFEETFKEFIDSFFNNSQSVKDKMLLKSTGYPRADVYIKNDNSLIFELAVPGLKKEDLEIEYDESTETFLVSGKHSSKANAFSNSEGEKVTNTNENRYIYQELKHSSFQRGWTIPKESLNLDKKQKITSELKDGILKICVPIKSKEEEKQKNKIKVEIT